jgi:hypothetical protein
MGTSQNQESLSRAGVPSTFNPPSRPRTPSSQFLFTRIAERNLPSNQAGRGVVRSVVAQRIKPTKEQKKRLLEFLAGSESHFAMISNPLPSREPNGERYGMDRTP